MSSAGIDFGTSNCFAHVASPAGVLPVRLDGADFGLASVAFTARRDVLPRAISEAEVERRADRLRIELRRNSGNASRRPDDAALDQIARDTLRREAAEEASQAWQDQTFFSALDAGAPVVFGAEAFRRHFAEPMSGFLVKSPKSFLGSDMDRRRLAAFEDIVTAMLAHIRRAAETQADTPVERAVLGRPVRYQGIGGDEADAQAIGVMERAAGRAGFKEVRFELEPLAAAYEYERGIDADQVVLVVDVGGGTTDCVMVRLGRRRAGATDRAGDILGVSGDRVGGNDFDESLAWRGFMPEFGKDTLLRSGLPLPHGVLHDAISIRDVPAQTRFLRAGEQIDRLSELSVVPERLERLVHLHGLQLQHQLVHSAEMAKIGLSTEDAVTSDLGFVSPGLTLALDRSLLLAATQAHIDRIRALADEALRPAGIRPDIVIMTGGMAISPVVSAAIGSLAGHDIPIRSTEMLGTVGRGLGLCAQRTFER